MGGESMRKIMRIAPVYDPNLRVYDVAALSGGGEIHPKDADVYYNRGLDYYNKGQYDQAISDYTKAIEINPNDADAYKHRACLFERHVRPGIRHKIKSYLEKVRKGGIE
jgi:tetratricopeptide (TPR) repeat protein